MKTQMPSYNLIASFYIAFTHEHGDTITNLKLQKLMYYTQARFLAVHDTPMFERDFEAWVHGPVLRPLYHDYKKFSYSPITHDEYNDKSMGEIWKGFSENVKSTIDYVIENYYIHNAFQLELLTHSEPPWQLARKGFQPYETCNVAINMESMKHFYKGIME